MIQGDIKPENIMLSGRHALVADFGVARALSTIGDYRLRGVPTSVFVGSDGVVRSVHPGPISEGILRERLSEILPK